VREIRDAILGFDPPGRGSKTACSVANVTIRVNVPAPLRFGQCRALQRIDRGTGGRVRLSLGICQFNGVERLLRLPIAIRYHGNEIIHVEHLDDAGHVLDCRRVHLGDLAAPDGWCLDRRIFHARQCHINRELSSAVDLCRNIHSGQRLAHQLVR